MAVLGLLEGDLSLVLPHCHSFGRIDAKNAERIKFLSTHEELLNYVDKEQLLKSYGGDDAWEYEST